MLAQVSGFVLQGIEAVGCEVEVDVADRGLVKTTIVGLPDVSVKESIERVRSAIINSGYSYPVSRLLINLAPADLRKEGPVYDLPIAVGMLLANGTIEGMSHKRYLFAGELALDGRIRPINGAIIMAILGRKMGMDGVIVPVDNASEASAVEGIDVYGADSLSSVVGFLNEEYEIEAEVGVDAERELARAACAIDFADIRGQETVKRAMTVAAAGGHNILMIGPAGTGKTMMAKALPGVLPALSREEALETTCIYSSAGLVPKGRSLMVHRPVRSPHHTASGPALIGGGTVPKAGEVSLAHHGVLFLDELPEFSRGVLETLRQPLEDGIVTIARAHSVVSYPARFMLVASMNPTPSGEFAVDGAGMREMERYMSRVSGPLIDRVDIHVEVPRVPFKQLAGRRNGTGSATMREVVMRARKVQSARQDGNGKGGVGGNGSGVNAGLSGRELDECAKLDDEGSEMLHAAMSELGLSARAYDKVRRVARTIADIEENEKVCGAHVAEAIQYRLLDRKM